VANNPKKEKKQKVENFPAPQPWLSMQRGMVIITITSIAMAVLTAWQVIPAKGWGEGLLWGLLFGAFIWAIFFGNLLVNRFLRK
jgi:hypothetical protein